MPAIKANKPILLLLSIIVLFGLLVTLRLFAVAAFREHFLPSAYSLKYSSTLQNKVDSEAASLERVLTVKLQVAHESYCVRDWAVRWRASIYCTADKSTQKSYTDSFETTNSKLQPLDPKIKQLGWKGGRETVWDGTPEAPQTPEVYVYNKNHDGFLCNLQIINDRNKKLSYNLYCSKTYNFLGDPYAL